MRDPGTGFDYSNLTSHLLGIIVARACDTDPKSYTQEYLFSPLGGEVGDWVRGCEGYYLGFAEIEKAHLDLVADFIASLPGE